MVDRVYRTGVPQLRKELLRLRERFSTLDTKTDWIRLRVDPVLTHAEELEKLLMSRKFSLGSSRLTKGVALFHSDLVYLRANVKGLEKILQSESKPRTNKRTRS